jgi:endonuclease YncB( thermonuclease family)
VRELIRSRTVLVGVAAILSAGAVEACTGDDPLTDDEPAAAAADSSGTGEVETGEEAEPPATPAAAKPRKPRAFAVARVIDGDTLELGDGRRVRLVQIDAPENGEECYGSKATAVLRTLLPAGSRIRIERDRSLDNVDRYGRLLRYVRKGASNINVVLVRRGAASVWFYDGDRGRHAERLLAGARRAKAQRRGAWGACNAKLDPSRGFDTSTKLPAITTTTETSTDGCAEGYRPCLPITGDLDCADVEALGLAPVAVTGGDPYRLDGDDDGIGCET